MTWFSRKALLVLCGALFSILSMMASASAEEERIPLTDDISRAELFAAMKPGDLEVLPKQFMFPADTKKEPNGQPRVDSHFGIDVSHHNEDDCHCQIDWSMMRAQNVVYVYLKASQGKVYFDPTFARNWEAVGKLPAAEKLYRGAYHFLSSDVPPIDQARNFLRTVPSLSVSDLPACLDLEWDNRKTPDGSMRDSWKDVAPQDIADHALAWLREVEAKTGRVPVIYTNRAWWRERIGEEKAKLFARYSIWIADYSRSGLATEVPGVPANGPWVLWQFSERGKLTNGGFGTSVDSNVFKGKLKDLLAKLGVSE